MNGFNDGREDFICSILLCLGERDRSSVSLHEMAEMLDVSLLDVLWGVVLLGRAGYVRYETHSPMQVTLQRDPEEIDFYRVADDLQDQIES